MSVVIKSVAELKQTSFREFLENLFIILSISDRNKEIVGNNSLSRKAERGDDQV